MILRCVRLLLLGVCSLLVVGPSEGAPMVEGRLGGSVELPCQRRPLDHPVEELLVYWQRDGQTVVAALVNGKMDPTNQAESFAGRVSFRSSGFRNGDFTLQLWSLRPEDGGDFVCLTIWSPSVAYDPQKSLITLRVTAAFSTPVILSATPGEVSYGQELTLTCTAYGGTRPPEIVWVNSSDGTPVHQGCFHSNHPRQQHFTNLTCTIAINVTASINISCALLTPSGNLSSLPYVVVLSADTQTDGRNGSSPLWVWLPVVSVAVVLGALAVMVKGRVGRPSGGRRRDSYQSGAAEETETGRGPKSPTGLAV